MSFDSQQDRSGLRPNGMQYKVSILFHSVIIIMKAIYETEEC